MEKTEIAEELIQKIEQVTNSLNGWRTDLDAALALVRKAQQQILVHEGILQGLEMAAGIVNPYGQASTGS